MAPERGGNPWWGAHELGDVFDAEFGFEKSGDDLTGGTTCSDDDDIFVAERDVLVPAGSMDDVTLEGVEAGNVEREFGFDQATHGGDDDFGTNDFGAQDCV